MTTFKPTFLLSLSLFAACWTANATTVTFAAVNGVDDGSYWIGPYTIKIDNYNYQAMCYDFTHEASLGQTWTAKLYTYSQLQKAYYAGEDNYVENYWKAAWLFSQLLQTNDSQVMIGIQHAVWSLFNTGTPTSGAAPWIQAANDAAVDGYPGLDVSAVRIVNAASERPTVQGFLVAGYGMEAPEPGTYAMMGTTLVLLGLIYRRRLHSK